MADISYRDVLARPGVRQSLVINQLGYAPGTRDYTNAVRYLLFVAQGKRSGEKSRKLAAAVDAAKVAAQRENDTGAGGIVTTGGGGGYTLPESFFYTGALNYNGRTEYRNGSEMRTDFITRNETRARVEALYNEIMRANDPKRIDELYMEIWFEIFEELTGYEATA